MKKKFDDKDIILLSKKILTKYKLCNHCLGRFFAKIDKNLSNKERGELISKNLDDLHPVKVKNCFLCEGLFNEINHFIKIIEEKLIEYEYETFLIGSKVDEDIIDRENEIIEEFNIEHSESIKSNLNREIGKILEKKLDKEVNFEKPTIMVVLDTSYDNISLQISSLYVYGRYKKFKRDIPQTKWHCKICRGKGCKRCKYTGRLYQNSVEELVSNNFLKKTKAEDESFHGAGREDIDVRMLGNGRPFVLEIKNPKIRNLNLKEIKDIINKENKSIIEIDNLKFSDREEIKRIKNSKFKKIYYVELKTDKSINKEKLKKVALSLRGKIVGQMTPSRVAHRRADLIRNKYIYDCTIESIDGAKASLKLETESGTYIKELISGDNGRTNPNISDMLGVPCQVNKLDVIFIKGE